MICREGFDSANWPLLPADLEDARSSLAHADSNGRVQLPAEEMQRLRSMQQAHRELMDRQQRQVRAFQAQIGNMTNALLAGHAIVGL